MKINVVYNKFIPDYQDSLYMVEHALLTKNVDFKSFELTNLENFGEISFVIGGDGTLLRAAKYYSANNIPVMGINTGRLGFLAQAGMNEIYNVIDSILDNDYKVEKRLMLESGEHTALNDFVIKGCVPGRTSKFFLEINGKFVCDYIADGIIISTPTGSTAYGLSAGGPVVSPHLDAIIIVPICPHTLNARPLVVPMDEIVTVKTNDNLLSVSIDGFVTTKCVEKAMVKLSNKKALLAFLNHNDFYSVLRNKLNWGVSPESKY